MFSIKGMIMVKTITSLKISDVEKLDDLFAQEDINIDLDGEQKKHLSPETNAILSREAVRKAVRDFGEDGLSINEIMELTDLNRSTIEKHLKNLIGLREVYSLKKNKKMTLYYNNGKPLHQLGKKRLDNGMSILEISIAQGRKNSHFFYILEKRYSILEGETAEGAVMLPMNELDEFITALLELQENYGGIVDASN